MSLGKWRNTAPGIVNAWKSYLESLDWLKFGEEAVSISILSSGMTLTTLKIKVYGWISKLSGGRLHLSSLARVQDKRIANHFIRSTGRRSLSTDTQTHE